MNRRQFLLTSVSLACLGSICAPQRAHATSIQSEHRGDVAILHLNGQFCMDLGVPLFRQRLREEMSSGFLFIVADMGGVSEVDSTMLGELASCYITAKNRRGELVLCNLSQSISELLTRTRLNQVFNMFSSVNAALEHFAQQKKPPYS